MKNSVLLTTLALSIIAGSALMAGNGQQNGRHHFKFDEVDTNSDGKVTQDEMIAHMQARFITADTNNDDLVSEDELRAHMENEMRKKIDRRVARMMNHHDGNDDGMLNMDEMKPKRMGKMIKHMDTDGDGAISKSEFQAMKGKHGKRHMFKDDG